MSRAMKNSGIPWIGEIPEGWKMDILSVLFFEHKCKNIGMCEKNLLSLSYGNIIKKDINTSEGLLPESFETYNIIDKGDIIFRLTDLQNDKRSLRTGLCKEKGIITSAYVCLRKRSTNSSEYFHYLFHAYDICKVFYSYGGGVRQGMNYADLRKMPIVFPPLSEQQAIADFLDKKCAEIDQMVALQEKFIEELKAYKQSLITETVTKGLNPNAPMKDSGVEWIGEVPEGWNVSRIKGFIGRFSKGEGITKDEVFPDGNTPCVRYGEIYTKYNNSFAKCVSATKIEIQESPHYFEKGNILCAGTGELIEEIGKSIVYVGEKKCLAGGDIIILKHNQHPVFLNYALNCPYAQAQKSCSKAKLKVVHISASDIGNVILALPPLPEQQAIADYLDKKCAEIDQLIAVKQKKADELKEYKKSIIYEYVTGKRSVCE